MACLLYTSSHKLYVDESETAIHVEYVLRASELQNGNQESVSRLNYICRTLPIYETYCSDAIMPKYDMLQPYRIPDDAHKEMPRRNLVIAFHKEFTSLWIKTIPVSYTHLFGAYLFSLISDSYCDVGTVCFKFNVFLQLENIKLK